MCCLRWRTEPLNFGKGTREPPKRGGSTLKRSILFSALLFVTAGSAQAQPGRGSKELSLSPSFTSSKAKESTESSEMLTLPVRLGYFVSDQFEIEPEFVLTVPDESEYTGIVGFFNLCYNFPTEGSAHPFLLAGIGYGNGYKRLFLAQDLDTGIFCFNFGAGLKLFLNEFVALRTEYRFRKYSGSKEEEGYHGNYTHDYGIRTHEILVGFSVFLK